MTDRELLELAAKAAGVEQGAERTECGISTTLPDGRHGYLPQWNPLTDDGDALRLAVRLGININFGNHDDGSVVAFDFTGRFSDCEESGDPDTATRRAIVRAAAEIGKQRNSHD